MSPRGKCKALSFLISGLPNLSSWQVINQLGVPGTEEFPALWDFQCYSKESPHELVTLHLGKGEVKVLRREWIIYISYPCVIKTAIQRKFAHARQCETLILYVGAKINIYLRLLLCSQKNHSFIHSFNMYETPGTVLGIRLLFLWCFYYSVCVYTGGREAEINGKA